MKTKQIEINGILTTVTICPPSKRKANSSIQKPKFQKTNTRKGELHCAEENGKFIEK